MIRIRLLEHRELPVIFLTAKGKTPDKVKGLRGGAAVFSGKMTRPLRKLSQATQELSEGNYDRRVQPRGRDEVALLMQDFNHMADGSSFYVLNRFENPQPMERKETELF